MPLLVLVHVGLHMSSVVVYGELLLVCTVDVQALRLVSGWAVSNVVV